MSLSIVRESFHSLEGPWRLLMRPEADGPESLVFTTPDWMRAWWETSQESDELLLLSLRKGGELVGVAPLMRCGDAIRFLGRSDVCDQHEFVFPQKEAPRLLGALLDELQRHHWRSLEMEGLPEGSPTLALLPALAAERGLTARTERDEVSPRIALPSSWDAYLGSLDKKDRHELRRKLRRLESAGQVWYGAARYASPCQLSGESGRERVRHPADLEKDMAVFLDLMRNSREVKAAFMTPQRERFFLRLASAMAGAGYLRLFFLELDGLRVAATFCFDYRDTRLLYNSGFDPQYAALSVGLLLKALCLKDAIGQGLKWYDLLRGAEPYKYQLGARDRWLYKMSITRGEVAGP